MTMIRSFTPAPKRQGELGIHSLDHFSLAIPDMKKAEDFYKAFGLDLKAERSQMELSCAKDTHTWGILTEGPAKKLRYISFAAFEEDFEPLRKRVEGVGVQLLDPPPGFDSNGFWFCDPDNILIEVKVAGKTSPNEKMSFEMVSSPEGESGAPYRRDRGPVKPRRMAHMLIFTSNVTRAIDFYHRTLGLRLSDRTGDGIAFLHGIHGSDHHLIAFAKSQAPGFHHCSWDVPSVNDVGLGAMQMADKGFSQGWGLGRHVLGSNYFHYVRDPWGSYCEYSSDIDYIPVTCEWEAKDHPPEDSFYLWGPQAPADFATNYEAGIPAVITTE
jgi:catechol 2,3-dioxygenase-like lactoylglutathione lyase family enzyme